MSVAAEPPRHLSKSVMGEVAAEIGWSAERFEASWANFVEFRDLVEGSAERLGIELGTARFSAFGLAMLEAQCMGEDDAIERLVWAGKLPAVLLGDGG